jgi:LuxR family maltose regulon positive regulatory protein
MQQAREERATDTLHMAVEAGRRELFIRPFLEHAPQALPLLRAVVGHGTDPYLAQLLSQAERLVPSTAATGSTSTIEPLTDREREVLGYLPSHLNRDQIATLMYLSPNTVKTHIQAVYRKMGATSRAEAVTIARSRGLLGLPAHADGVYRG